MQEKNMEDQIRVKNAGGFVRICG